MREDEGEESLNYSSHRFTKRSFHFVKKNTADFRTKSNERLNNFLIN